MMVMIAEKTSAVAEMSVEKWRKVVLEVVKQAANTHVRPRAPSELPLPRAPPPIATNRTPSTAAAATNTAAEAQPHTRRAAG